MEESFGKHRRFAFRCWEDPLEEGMATHSSILAWRIPWTEKPGRLQSIGLQKVRHNSSDLAHVQRITGSQDKLQTTDLYQNLKGLSTTKPSSSFSDSPWTPFVLPSCPRIYSPEFSCWVCVLLKWSPEMRCNLPFFLFYKWAKEDLSVGPYIAYIFTTSWDPLAQKPACAKLKCLYI